MKNSKASYFLKIIIYVRRNRKLWIAIWIALISLNSFAQNYYVSTTGNDLNSGSLTAPFMTIQKGVDNLFPGDTLFIRGGSYHEKVIIDQKHGIENYPIVITAYQNEEVLLDGTIPIETSWTLHTGNIYKTTIPEDIWQLFVNDRMQVIARWPNASTHPLDPFQRKQGSYQPVDGTWWSKETTWANADAPTTENGVVENNTAYHDLAATGKNFTGGTVLLSVLEQGGDGNQERIITNHTAGTNTFTHPVLFPPKLDKAYRTNGKYYIIEHLEALDKEEEWYYIDSTKTIYLWPKGGVDPSGLSIRGRNISRSIELSNSSYVEIRGLDFFASNFAIEGDHITIEDCSILYPDASKRLLGIYPETSTVTSEEYGSYVNGANFSLINCKLEYSEYSVLFVENGDASRIHNSLFRHTSMLGLGKNGAIEQVNTYTRNTFEISGNRGAVKTNTDPESGRNQSYNYFNGYGFLQVPDGASLQAATNKTPGTIRSYNWFTYALKYGSRWDGKPAGIHGTNHHQVGLMVKGTLQVKGDDHNTINNSSFYSQEQNDIILLSDIAYGGNQLSRTYNNLADKISGHRSVSVATFPIPGSHSNNWNGYNEDGDAADQVYDILNHDFRPRPGSDLVDAGKIIPDFTNDYLGHAPDIGAYEFGDSSYWIPGYQADIASRPIPAHQGTSNYEFVDLMWLEAYNSNESEVYFGLSETAVENAGNQSPEFKRRQSNNIYNPDTLSTGVTYFWRIDAIVEGITVKGKVWSFTAGIDANDYSKKDIVIQASITDRNSGEPVRLAFVSYNDKQMFTNSEGQVIMDQLTNGKVIYTVEHSYYFSLIDSLILTEDTTIHLKLTPLLANVSFSVTDQQGPVESATVTFGQWETSTFSNGFAYLVSLPARQKYGYEVINEGYETITDSLWLEIDTTVAVFLSLPESDGAMESLNDIIIYPNPASDYLNILSEETAKFKLINISGKILLERNICNGKNEIDLGSVHDGLYFIQIETERKIHKRKIIISNY